MTAKRFTIDDAGTLIDMQTRDTFDYVSDVGPVLNNLVDENEQLKTFLESLREELSLADRDNTTLEKENEQLKKQLNRLYNYFEDWYSEMTSANDFSEIWDNVKEDERWGDVE